LGKNFPQSTNGINVKTVPAAAINFKKSRLETLPPKFGGVCCDIITELKNRIYKLLARLEWRIFHLEIQSIR
jgi:hypothetical protein